MFSRAVVATDLSPSSEGIIACAGTLGALGVREAILVYALDLDHEPSAEEDAAFSRQAESLEAAGIRVHVETPLGYPPHAIASLAEEREVGLIVMGTRGQGLFHTGFSGSVSSDVVRLSPVPVLLTPGSIAGTAETGGAVCSRLLSSVLVPVDLSEASDHLCDLACSLAHGEVPRLELLHVVELSFAAAREGREEKARRDLDALSARARDARIREVLATIVRGVPDEVVADYAASGEYSLIVLAPRCHDTIDQEFNSVTSAVIRRSATPVLLAPPRCDTMLHGRGNT